MKLSVGEKVKILLGRKNWTISQLAEATGQSRQNLTNKFTRDDFSESEGQKMAEALGYEFEPIFRDKETGETL